MRVIMNHLHLLILTIFVVFLGQSLPKAHLSVFQKSSALTLSSISESPRLKGFGVTSPIDNALLFETLRNQNEALSRFEGSLRVYGQPNQLLSKVSTLKIFEHQSPESLLSHVNHKPTLRLSTDLKVLPTSLDNKVLGTLMAQRPSVLSSSDPIELWGNLLHAVNSVTTSRNLSSNRRAFAFVLKTHQPLKLELMKNNSVSEARHFLSQHKNTDWSWVFDGSVPEEKVQYFAQIQEARRVLHRILTYESPAPKIMDAPSIYQRLSDQNSGNYVRVNKIMTGHQTHWLVTVKNDEKLIKSLDEKIVEFQFQMDLARNISDLRGQHFRLTSTEYFNSSFGLLSSSVSFMTSILAERKDKAHIGVIDSFKKQFEVENRKCASAQPLVRCHYNEKLMVALANALNVFEYSRLIDRAEIYVRGR